MKKTAFTIVEVAFVVILIFCVAFLTIPSVMDDSKQAQNIESWREVLHKTQYMFNVISAQIDDTQSKADDKRTLSQRIEPLVRQYLRVVSDVDAKDYVVKYKNGIPVKKSDFYKMDTLYVTEDSKIVGIKWLDNNNDKERPLAIMSFDVNGSESPNRWGEDIFGVNVYQDKVEAIGKEQDIEKMKMNCSTFGEGTYCSQYYIIGGSFD